MLAYLKHMNGGEAASVMYDWQRKLEHKMGKFFVLVCKKHTHVWYFVQLISEFIRLFTSGSIQKR